MTPVDRRDPRPAAEARRSFASPTRKPIVQHRLGNGLRVVLVPEPQIPIVAVSLWYGVGSRHEPPGRSGFAHLFEHVMFQGSANVAKGEHFRLIQASGGRTNAYTGLDATVYSEQLPSHELELGLWLEADRLQSLGEALSQETLDNQRDVVKNEKRKKVDNQPYGTWEERIFALAYPAGHPYHHSSWGSMEDLSAASLDDVRAFFSDHYRPNNAVLAVVGDMDVGQAIELVERHFGAIPAGAVPPPPRATGGAFADAAARQVISEHVPLPKIYVGCPIPPFGDDRFVAADMVSDLLATGRAARLHDRLVREQRLAQSVNAWTFPLIEGAALLLISATAREDVAPERLQAGLDGELDRLAAELVDEAELDRVRLQRATNRAALLERAEERADRIGMFAALLDAPELFGSEEAADRAVHPEAVRAVSERWLGPANRACLWYLPRER